MVTATQAMHGYTDKSYMTTLIEVMHDYTDRTTAMKAMQSCINESHAELYQ